jgi:hypothetical protein
VAEPIEDPLQETGQVLGSALRTGAVAAGELVRMHLLRQARQDHEATQAAQLEARALTERLKAEKPLAAALYRPTRDPAWWDQATTDDVARAWDAASAFADVDPDAKAALEDLDRGLEERPALRDRLLRDHPESLAAQSLAPLATHSADAGIALAIAADLELDPTPDLGLTDEELEQAWRTIPPEPEPTQEDEPSSRTPPDPALSEEELWAGTPSEPEPIHEEETPYEPWLNADLRSPPDSEASLHHHHSPDAGPGSRAEPPSPATASPDYQEAAGVAALVGADFPAGASRLDGPGSEVHSHTRTAGITPVASQSGPAAEYQQAADVAALVRPDFPTGAGVAAPAVRLGALAGTPWGVQSALPVPLTELELTAPGVER